MTIKELTADGTARSVSVQGLKLNYHEAGQGYPLVLLHGGGPGASSWSNYRGNIGVLSEHFRVIAVDLPHFGKSDKPADKFINCGWYAEVLAEALKEIDAPRAHFVGNSMGGIVSMELALAAPDMVDRLILMGVPGAISVVTVRPTEGEKHMIEYYHGEGPTPAKLEAFIRSMVFDQSLVTPELLESRFQASTAPELMVKRKLDGTSLINMWRRADQIQHKTLLVHGHDDRVVPWDAAMTLLRLMPNADLHVFGRCGHWAQWERAEEFNALALNFFTTPNTK
jgi:pimeloyl-ACP methyl ester carboxylesterase